jgi:phosphoesterase RecJ-like protein
VAPLTSTFPEFLRRHQRILLTGHENPDGDCLGAQTALFHLLRALGQQAVIVNPDPIGRSFEFLQRHTPFGHARGEQPLPPFDAVVLLDCAQLSRLGPLGPRLQQSGKPIGVIDHHVGSEHGDGEACFVDVQAAATGALVRRLFRHFDVPLTAAAAEGVFLSLVADTGWFRYSNTNPEVFTMAAELVAAGVDVSLVYDSLYRRNHPESAALLVDALQRHRLLLGGRLAMVSLDRVLMERAGRIEFDTDGILEPLRSLEGIEVVAVLKERFDGTVKASLRARADVDVQSIVARFGGGGHKKAAGATMRMPLAAAEAALEAEVRSALAAAGTEVS